MTYRTSPGRWTLYDLNGGTGSHDNGRDKRVTVTGFVGVPTEEVEKEDLRLFKME